MNFNSPQFALFLPLVLVTYYFLHFVVRSRWAENLMLLLASCFFYGMWDHRFLFLFLFSTALDYVCGLAMANRRPPPLQTGVLAICMVGGAFFLCAPIDWHAVRALMMPAEAYAGGWAQPALFTGLFVAGGDWSIAVAAFTGIVVETVLFLIGYQLRGSAHKTYFLAISVVSQLTLLAFFKYFDFFVEGAARLLDALGLGTYHWALGVMVPVGISFYTFHTMSYTIDIYRGRLTPTDSLVDFALFVAYFPQMVAGPIARASELLPQFEQPRHLDWDQAQSGAFLIGWGLFKKIFIADNLLRVVTGPYTAGAVNQGAEVLVATYAFAVQIYCDFSAYSDIARGASRLMGIELMLNFNIPYAATNPRDFWRRWHISLSTWLRDYLYLPLGGNRGGELMMYRNLMLTMILGGIWHGARMNFLWWGIYQGLLLVGHRLAEPALKAMTPESGLPRLAFKALCWLAFFHLVCFGWLLFRAESNSQIVELMTALATRWSDTGLAAGMLARLVWFCWPLCLVQLFQVRTGNLLAPLTWHWPLRAAFYVGIFYLTTIFGAFHVVEFIYFQF